MGNQGDRNGASDKDQGSSIHVNAIDSGMAELLRPVTTNQKIKTKE
jgi:hypothetical protein